MSVYDNLIGGVWIPLASRFAVPPDGQGFVPAPNGIPTHCHPVFLGAFSTNRAVRFFSEHVLKYGVLRVFQPKSKPFQSPVRYPSVTVDSRPLR